MLNTHLLNHLSEQYNRASALVGPDVNYFVNVIGPLGGIVDETDLAQMFLAKPNNVLASARVLVTSGKRLILSEYSLDTLKRVLMNPSKDKKTGELPFTPLTEAEADASVDALIDIAVASGGLVVSLAQTKAMYPFAKALVPAELIGDEYGTVDHEDLMVLSSIMAAAKMYGDRVDLVSNDHGFFAIAEYVTCAGVDVAATKTWAEVLVSA